MAVPLIPFSAWVLMLLAYEAHGKLHVRVAGTLLKIRRKAWIVKGKIIAQRIVDQCLTCQTQTLIRCLQDLPQERVMPASPLEFTAIGLFSPFQVKDDIKRRVTMKVRGVVFCCMANRTIHEDLTNTLSTERFY